MGLGYWTVLLGLLEGSVIWALLGRRALLGYLGGFKSRSFIRTRGHLGEHVEGPCDARGAGQQRGVRVPEPLSGACRWEGDFFPVSLVNGNAHR